MVKEIKCPEKNLENFILFGEQVLAYRSFRGEPDSKKVGEKTLNYYKKGKKYAEQFKDGKEFMLSLKAHIGICHECSEEISKLKEKYKIPREELEKLTKQEKENLEYFELLE